MSAEPVEQNDSKKSGPIVKEPRTGKILVWIGIAVTAIYAFLLFQYFKYWPTLSELEPEKLGSFLSGAVSPLAFFWLVLGFFQQGSELKHSARALWLQSEELRNSVEQQKALVAVAREQIDHERTGREYAQHEVQRLAQPIFGIQSNGSISSSGAHQFEFLIANAGATCTSVRLAEGEESFGEAASLAAGSSVTVNFRFELDEPIRERSLTISYTDALGVANEQAFTFPLVERNGQSSLSAPIRD